MATGEEGEKRAFDFLICPIYNVSRIKLGDALRTLGLCFPQEFTSNFMPVLVNIRNFLGAHDFLSDTFGAKQGYRLEAIVSVLWAIGNILTLPEPYLLAKTEEARLKIFRDTMMNVLQRGYGVYDFEAKKITPRLQSRIKLFSSDINVTDDEIQAILNRITLTPERQRSISLWSGGPQHVLIPAGQHQGVFLQSVPMMLNTMFVRVAHNQSKRGTVFEEAFRRALSNRGFRFQSGPLQSVAEGEREMDAGVVIGDVLYAFECVSVERPLDYEIGSLTTFSRRSERLDGKVTQVLTLADFLRAEPRGTNYDFTQVREIVPACRFPV